MLHVVHHNLKRAMWDGVRLGLAPETVIVIGKNVLKTFGHEKFGEIQDVVVANKAFTRIREAVNAAAKEKQR